MNRPLIHCLIALMTGIVAGSYVHLSFDRVLFVAALLLLFILISIRKKSFTTAFLLIMCFIVLLGFFNIQKQAYFFKNDLDILRYTHQGKLSVEGLVIESPVVYQDKDVLIVRCMRIFKDHSYIPTAGTIRLAVPPDANFHYGDFIRFHSNIKKIQNFNNPGRFDYERFMNRQGIYVSGFIDNPSDIVLLRTNTAGGIKLTLDSFRNYLQDIIKNNSFSPEKEIITAMTLGNQNEIPPDIRDDFTKTGTAHILSISGLHIGMVAGTFFFFAFFLLKSSEYMMLRFNTIKIAAITAFVMVFIYALIAGMGVTVMRATLMAFIFLIALLMGRQKDMYNVLAVAGLVILGVSPDALFDISFQLSFISVFAIIYIVPRLRFSFFDQFSSFPSWIRGMIYYIDLSARVCMAATLGTLPLVLYYFDSLSLVTLIANMVVVPLLGTLTLSLSMFFILCSFSPVLSGYIIQLASFLTQISISIIHQMASFSWSSISMTKPHWIEIVLFYGFIFICAEFIDEKENVKATHKNSSFKLRVLKYLSMTIILCFVADITYWSFRDKFSSDLKITILDVGQGNSTFVEFPGGTHMMIDGGGFAKGSFDIGRGVLAPFLYKKKVRHVETAVLSHPHPDHLIGLIFIMNHFRVRQIWETGAQVDRKIFPGWGKTIKSNHINVSIMSNKQPEIIIQNVKINILWPPDLSLADIKNFSYDQENDFSAVLKITYGHIRFLIPGDISADIEKKLIQSGIDLKSDVLVVPHHGSDHSSSPEFIRAVGCRYAVVSAGKSNIFKHPHPSVLERYLRAGVKIYRTDRDGAILFKTDGTTLTLDTFIQPDKYTD